MIQSPHKEGYHKFATKFEERFSERICPFDEEARSYILAVVNSTEGFKTQDNYGRDSEYFTFSYKDVLITVVCDPRSHVIVTVIRELHKRSKFIGK